MSDPDKDKENRAHAPAEEDRKDTTQEPPRKQRINHDDPVEEASDESFPASDPPASY